MQSAMKLGLGLVLSAILAGCCTKGRQPPQGDEQHLGDRERQQEAVERHHRQMQQREMQRALRARQVED